MRALFGFGLLTLAPVLLVACGQTLEVDLGASCTESAQCASGLCASQQCVDPRGDEDGDGLDNAFEAGNGTDPKDKDSDGDGKPDPDELGPDKELVDTDGDGRPDVIESAVSDADGDCISDERDARDATPDEDLSPMVPVVCPDAGICAEQRARLRAVCGSDGVAACAFDDVVGYASPEASCDGVDENCDGRVDEGFAAGCARTSPTALIPARGGRTVATGRYRLTLVQGHPATGVTTSANRRAVFGVSPGFAPAPLQTAPENP
jgi:hypothetical protein